MIGPVKKRSVAKKKQRHSAWKNKKIKFWKKKIQTRWSDEGQCWKLNHRVCPVSGVYRGRKVLTVKTSSGTVIEA